MIGKNIPLNSDLNNYITVGNYYQQNSATLASLLNKPQAMSSGEMRLEVRYSQDAGFLIQVFDWLTPSGNSQYCHKWMRAKRGSVWGAWEKIYTNQDAYAKTEVDTLLSNKVKSWNISVGSTDTSRKYLVIKPTMRIASGSRSNFLITGAEQSSNGAFMYWFHVSGQFTVSQYGYRKIFDESTPAHTFTMCNSQQATALGYPCMVITLPQSGIWAYYQIVDIGHCFSNISTEQVATNPLA